MKIVIDTNIMFSTLIVAHAKREHVLFGDLHQFFAPSFALLELYEKQGKILKYTKRTPREFYRIFEQLIRSIHVTADSQISLHSKQEAYRLCQDVDLKDIPFVALAIELSACLWTGDKVLKERLNAKGYVHFFQL